MKKLAWYLRQLLPLHYRSDYISGGKRMRSCWRMWMGKCYQHEFVCIPERFERGLRESQQVHPAKGICLGLIGPEATSEIIAHIEKHESKRAEETDR